MDNLHGAELETLEIPKIGFSLSFKPSNTSDKDPRLQHPYSSFPFDTADLDSPSNGHLI